MSVTHSPEASSVRVPGNQSSRGKGYLRLCPPSSIDCRDLIGRDIEITRDGQYQPEQGSAAGQPIIKIQQWAVSEYLGKQIDVRLAGSSQI